MKFYNIQNVSDDKVIIDIDGVIGVWWDGSDESKNTKQQIRNFLNEINSNVNTILVRIASLGGSVDHGLMIYDALKQHDASIEVEVYGMTASAATVISQAADPGKLKMSKNAMFLIHEAWLMAVANKTEMKNTIETLETIDGILADIYVERSGKELSEITELMASDNGNGKWLNADTAKEYGLIDEIIQAKEEDNAANTYKFAAFGGKIPMPKIELPENNNVEEENSMEDKLFTVAEMEAAKKEVIENITKHLNWIDKAENSTILENIKSGANYADCVEKYAEEKISRMENANRQADLTPENIEHIDAADQLETRGDNIEDKADDVYNYMKETGYLK